METDNLLEELQKIDKLELPASIQVKKGWNYVVISYVGENGKPKPIWRATGIKAVPGNKKEAKNKIPEVVNRFKEELKQKLQEKYTAKQQDMTPEKLMSKYENEGIIEEDDISSETVAPGTVRQRIEKYRQMSFVSFIEDSLKEFKPRVAGTTLRNWESIVNGRISDYFRFIPENQKCMMMDSNIERPIFYETTPKIIQITQFDIEDFFRWLYDCKLKGATVDKYYELFNLVFARAVRKKIIRKIHNPMIDIPKPHIDPYIADYYKSSELKKLFEIVRDDILELPILIAGTYGLRRSEVIGLKWDAVNLDNDTFVVKHTVTNVTGEKEEQVIEARDLTKSKFGYRTYPLTPEIKKALIKQRVNIETNKKLIYKDKYIKQTKDYICLKEDGSLIKPDHFTRRFKLLIKQHNLREIRLHDIRHTVGSLLAINNVNLRQIQEYLGHGSIRSTERYSNLQYETKQNAVDVMNNQTNNIFINAVSEVYAQ